MEEKHLDLDDWVAKARDDQDKEFRQAIHTILQAISSHAKLKANMVLKGGVLLALKYSSDRFTKDIDLSTDKELTQIEPDEIRKHLEESLTVAVEELDYSLDCRVQNFSVEPRNITNPTFPSISITIGHAYKGTAKHKRLMNGTSTDVVSLDYSINEVIPNIEPLDLSQTHTVLAYSFEDLMAEKYRALLQQKVRNRARRQDIYDLFFLLEICGTVQDPEKAEILRSLRSKCSSRGINPDRDSLRDEEISERAKRDYHKLRDEIVGQLPDFDEAYERVKAFYEDLPWN